MRRHAVLLAALLALAPILAEAAQPEIPAAGPLPQGILGMAGAAWQGSAILAGGRNASGAYLDGVLRYDPATGSATRIATLPKTDPAALDGREFSAAFALADRVYVAGGFVRVQPLSFTSPPAHSLSDIIEIDPANGTATPIADALPSGRAGIAAAVVAGRAYLVGGYAIDPAGGPSKYFDDVLAYDPSAPEGARLSVAGHFAVPIRDATAVPLDGALMLFGGQTNNGTGAWACPTGQTICQSANIARYDLTNGTTTIVGQLPYGASGLAAARLGNAVFAMGSTNATSSNVTRVDLATGALTRPIVMESAPTFASSVVLQDALYVFGGRLASSSTPIAQVRIFYGDVLPPLPPLAVVARPDATGMTIAWLPPLRGSGLSYHVDRVASNGSVTTVYDGAATSAHDAEAAAGVALHYRVVAVNGTRRGVAVDVHAIGGAAPLPALTNVTAISASGHTRIAWDPRADATGYVIERDGARVASLLPSATAFEEDATGTYVARAAANGVEGEPGALLVPTAIPPTTGLAATIAISPERTSVGVVLTWEGNGSDTFEVREGDTPVSLEHLALVHGSTFTVAHLVPGSTQWFDVRRVYGTLQGGSTGALRIDVPPEPRAPGWIYANASAHDITLSWDDARGENDTYTLWRTGADGVERALATNLTNATFVDAAVAPNVAYTYSVTTEGQLASLHSQEATTSLGAEASPTPSTPAPPPTPTSPPTRPTAITVIVPTSPTGTPATTPEEQHIQPTSTPTSSGSAPTPGLGLAALVVALALVARMRKAS